MSWPHRWRPCALRREPAKRPSDGRRPTFEASQVRRPGRRSAPQGRPRWRGAAGGGGSEGSMSIPVPGRAASLTFSRPPPTYPVLSSRSRLPHLEAPEQPSVSMSQALFPGHFVSPDRFVWCRPGARPSRAGVGSRIEGQAWREQTWAGWLNSPAKDKERPPPRSCVVSSFVQVRQHTETGDHRGRRRDTQTTTTNTHRRRATTTSNHTQAPAQRRPHQQVHIWQGYIFGHFRQKGLHYAAVDCPGLAEDTYRGTWTSRPTTVASESRWTSRLRR